MSTAFTAKMDAGEFHQVVEALQSCGLTQTKAHECAEAVHQRLFNTTRYESHGAWKNAYYNQHPVNKK
jgi:hypothetical protein